MPTKHIVVYANSLHDLGIELDKTSEQHNVFATNIFQNNFADGKRWMAICYAKKPSVTVYKQDISNMETS